MGGAGRAVAQSGIVQPPPRDPLEISRVCGSVASPRTVVRTMIPRVLLKG